MEENLSPVNAEPEQTVDAQIEVPDTGESQVEPVSEPAEPKPVQTPEENAHFAEQRRAREAAEADARQAKKDNEIARKYGAEWGVFSETEIAEKYAHLGITNMEQFEKAVERQKMIDEGKDPDEFYEKLNNHPDVVKAREASNKAQNYAEFQAFYLKNVGPMPEFKDLPKPVIDAFAKGESMKIAYMDWDYSQFSERRKADEINKRNAESSTGSLTGNGKAPAGLTEEMVEQMTDKERIARWAEIKELYKMK